MRDPRRCDSRVFRVFAGLRSREWQSTTTSGPLVKRSETHVFEFHALIGATAATSTPRIREHFATRATAASQNPSRPRSIVRAHTRSFHRRRLFIIGIRIWYLIKMVIATSCLRRKGEKGWRNSKASTSKKCHALRQTVYISLLRLRALNMIQSDPLRRAHNT